MVQIGIPPLHAVQMAGSSDGAILKGGVCCFQEFLMLTCGVRASPVCEVGLPPACGIGLPLACGDGVLLGRIIFNFKL